MCTLVIAVQPGGAPGYFAIFNRDEMLDRPASAPQIIQRQQQKILAPRDQRAGGTWLGLNDRGLFAGITNRFGMTKRDHHRSRGHVVFDALESVDAHEAVEQVAANSPGRHNGFHLVVADRNGAFVVWSDTERIRSSELSPGLHVITERSFGAAESLRLRRMTRRVEQLEGWNPRVRTQIRQWMSEHHDDDPLESTCVHLTGRNYGTRSSTIVEVGQRRQFAHAPGPPCSTEYRRYYKQLHRLGL